MPSNSTRRFTLLVCTAVTALSVACGGGGNGGGGSMTPTSPTPPTDGGGLPTAVTITIGANGQVSPANVTIAAGGRVTFVNNHNQPHDMASDPHPEHTDCPEINQVGFLTPGQTRTSGNLNTRRTCGFHDHNQPNVVALQGRIVIQ
jgi:plastocyanin